MIIKVPMEAERIYKEINERQIELNEAIAKLLSENPVQQKAEPKSWIYRGRERACRSNRLFRLIARRYPAGEQAGYKKYPSDSRCQRAAKGSHPKERGNIPT